MDIEVISGVVHTGTGNARSTTKAANIAKYDFTSHTQLPPDSS